MAGTRQVPDRSRQKARTRAAIIDAAAEMVRQGRRPTLAAAAAAAGVHRATAHRYFPTPDSLLLEASLTASVPPPAQMLRDVPPDDPFALLDAVVRGVSTAAFGQEALFRTIVRATIDRWFAEQADGGDEDRDDGEGDPVRETRRFDYLAPVLAATGLPDRERTRLGHALALLFGAESVVVTRDVCRLDPDEAVDTLAWAAATLLRGALLLAAGPSPSSGR